MDEQRRARSRSIDELAPPKLPAVSAPHLLPSPIAHHSEIDSAGDLPPHIDPDEASAAAIVKQLEGHNPPHLATFAAAVVAGRLLSESLVAAAAGTNAKTIPILQLTRQPSAPGAVTYHDIIDGDSRPPRDPSSAAARPSHQVTFSDGGDGSALPGAGVAGAAGVNFLKPSPSLGPRGLSVPTNLCLDDGDSSSGPQVSWTQQTVPFNHLAQRPSAEMFGSGVGTRKDIPPSPPSVIPFVQPQDGDSLDQPLLTDSPSPPTDAASALERDLSAKQSADLVILSKGLGRRQLKAMLRKNWLLKIRNPGQFTCELLSPLLMVMVIVIGWIFSLRHISDYPDERFADDTGVVQEVFDWVMNHISPLPENRFEYDQAHQRSLTNRFAHRREAQAGFVYGRSREEALHADADTDGDFYHPLSDFSHLSSPVELLTARRPNSSFAASYAPQPHPPPIINNVTCFPIDTKPPKQFCYDVTDADLIPKLLDYNGPMHIPKFDEFVTVHMVMKQLANNSFHSLDVGSDLDRLDRLTGGELGNLIFLGKLFFTPDIPEVHELVQRLTSTLTLFQSVFTGIVVDESTALDLAQRNLEDDTDRTWALINFNQLDFLGGQLDYTIRMNSSALPSTKSFVHRFAKGIVEDYRQYYFSGFLTLQITIEEAALQVSAEAAAAAAASMGYTDTHTTAIPLNNASSLEQTIMGVPFPVLHYRGNSFYQTIGPLIGLVFCMSILYPTSRLIKGIVEEKETKTKETMRIMGLKDWVFNGSWFITFFLQFFVTAVGLVILLHFTLFPNADPSLLGAFFICFFMSEITLGFLITVFFSRAKLAGILGPIILFAATMPRYAFFSKDAAAQNSNESIAAKTFVSVFSPTAFTFGADLLVQYEEANQKLGWSNLHDDAFSMGRVMSLLLIDFVLYAVLAWYIDRVMPNEYGQHLHPLFFCKRAYWRDQLTADYIDEEDIDGADGAVIEPVPPSMHASARVHIKKLRKQFTEGRGKNAKTTTAVNGLNLTLYEGQITALLGHNGAGSGETHTHKTRIKIIRSHRPSTHYYN